MADIGELVRSLGGIAQKRQLVRRGARDIDLTRAVREGEVIRARQGWYTTLGARDPCVRAVRVGGRLTGISAITALGGWVLGPHPLHVSVPVNAARLRTQQSRHRSLNVRAPAGVELHWDSADLGSRGTPMIVGLLDALHRVLCDEPLERAIAAVDWALHTGQIEMFDVEVLLLGLPRHKRIPNDWFDAACESLPESLARTRFRLAGYRVRSQVELETGERIDLVVEDFVAVDVDGETYHRETFVADRRKELQAAAEHFHMLRPPATTVFSDWTHVLKGVEGALEARRLSLRLGNSGVRPAKPAKRPRERGGAPRTPEFPRSQERTREWGAARRG